MSDPSRQPSVLSDTSGEIPSESGTYEYAYQKAIRGRSRMKIALVAAASALAGGVAAAWYYRRTVSLLQNPPEQEGHSKFGIDSDSEDDSEQHI